MQILTLTVIAFFSGSVMYSYLFSKAIARVDLLRVGDRNPGTINAFRNAGFLVGLLSMLMDFLKGFLPVYFAFWTLNIRDAGIIPIALAPVLGHAFSPFLKGKGGKAVAVTFGIWSGIGLWVLPTFLGSCMIVFAFVLVLEPDVWKTNFSMILMLLFILFYYRNGYLPVLWTFNMAILQIKHIRELKKPIRYRLLMMKPSESREKE
ncbi:MAG TPA: glycerol-3-phosphate acyltransferase [Thermotogota bacterium]|nr:glycerol-3-phosphate acyltransferase [Thermotogota bacterium]